MSTVVLACNTLEDEIFKVMDELNCNHQIMWFEAGLHNQPLKLHEQIKDKLACLKSFSRVLLCMGYCGGAAVGLTTGNFELVIPKVDDCISLMMGSIAARYKAGCEAGTYFLSAGWLRSTENIFVNFEGDCRRYGQQTALKIYTIMLKNYQRFAFIETNTYDPEQEIKKIKELSDLLNIDIERLPGDLTWLKQLLSGPWNTDNFIILPPWSELTADMWSWMN